MPKLLPLTKVADPFADAPVVWRDDAAGLTAHLGSVFDVLPRLPAKSVHACITSPPYWNLRDYRTATWVGGDAACDHTRDFQPRSERANPSASDPGRGGAYADEQAKAMAAYRDVCGKCGARRVDEQLGAEPLHDCDTKGQAQCGRCYVCNTVRWCREVRRVLRDDGVFWLNIGDSFSSGASGQNGTGPRTTMTSPDTGANDRGPRPRFMGLPSGNLLGIPWRVALALQADGWTLRSECPWFCRNKMPESAATRPGKSLEYVFMLTKGMDYFFDMEAVRQAAKTEPHARGGVCRGGQTAGPMDRNGSSQYDAKEQARVYGDAGGRNFRNSDLWFESVDAPHGLCGVGDELIGLDVTINGFKGAHFATFPSKLIEPLIKSSTSERGCCSRCGAPWQRILDKDRVATRPGLDTKVVTKGERAANEVTGNRDPERHVTQTRTVGWEPTCHCGADVVPCTVLEPFLGSGTTMLVSNQLGRRCTGVELSKEYHAMAVERMERHLLYPKYSAAAPVAPDAYDPFLGG